VNADNQNVLRTIGDLIDLRQPQVYRFNIGDSH
jgi:hypothetical protein